jgi:hypothetical protein
LGIKILGSLRFIVIYQRTIHKVSLFLADHLFLCQLMKIGWPFHYFRENHSWSAWPSIPTICYEYHWYYWLRQSSLLGCSVRRTGVGHNHNKYVRTPPPPPFSLRDLDIELNWSIPTNLLVIYVC